MTKAMRGKTEVACIMTWASEVKRAIKRPCKVSPPCQTLGMHVLQLCQIKQLHM